METGAYERAAGTGQPLPPTIEQLYRDEHAPVLRYLQRLVDSRETAEDLVQETFVKALRHWDQRTGASARGWLFRIARNTAFDYLRRRRQLPVLPLDDHTVPGTAPPMAVDDTEPILEALRLLPDRYRVPLLLQLTGGYAPSDIAALLGCNAGTVRTRLHRARAQFRALYVRHA